MSNHGDPFYLLKMVLKNGGVIETEAGTSIIEVSAAGVVSINVDVNRTPEGILECRIYGRDFDMRERCTVALPSSKVVTCR